MSLWTAAGGGRGVTYVGVIRVWAWGHTYCSTHWGTDIRSTQQTIDAPWLNGEMKWKGKEGEQVKKHRKSSLRYCRHIESNIFFSLSEAPCFIYWCLVVAWKLSGGSRAPCVASRCLHSLLSDSRSRPKYTTCLASRVPLWYFYDIMYSIWTRKNLWFISGDPADNHNNHCVICVWQLEGPL